MARFNVGDRVRMPDDYFSEKVRGATGTIVGIEFEVAYLVRCDGAYPVAASISDVGRDDGWSVWDEDGTRLTLLTDESNDPASTPNAYNVGDRVTIVNANSEDRLVDYIVSETTKEHGVDEIDGIVVAIDHAGAGDVFFAVVPTDEKYRCPWDDEGAWWCDEDDIVRSTTTPETPTAKPRRRSTKKVDKTAINVVQVDTTRAMQGDDRPARSKSDEFTNILIDWIASGDVEPSQVYFTNGLGASS